MKFSVNLEGIFAKVQRARKQLSWLEDDMTTFCQSQKQLIVQEIDKESGKQAYVFQGDNPTVPVEFSIRVGEIAHNLRSSLDQLVWQLVISNGNAPNEKNGFPIFKSATMYKNHVEPLLRGVASGAQTCIESCQPFQKHGGIGSQLWILHCLNNIDKHRHVNMTVLWSRTPHAEIVEDPPQIEESSITGYANVGELKKGMVLAVFMNPHVIANIAFRFSVVFGPIKIEGKLKEPALSEVRSFDSIEEEFDLVKKHGPAGRPVMDTLRKCLGDVEAVCTSLGIHSF